MISKIFPYNPVIKSMEYNGPVQELTIYFANGSVKTYAEVPSEKFYKIFYMQTLKEMLSYYAKEMRKKFKVIKSNSQPFKKPTHTNDYVRTNRP